MNLSMIDAKKQIRSEVKLFKNSFSYEQLKEKSITIFNIINSLPEVRLANYILSYWSLNDEVHTHDWNKKQLLLNKNILLPSVKDNDLEIRYFEGEDKMTIKEPFGIKESTGKILNDLSKIEVVLVPGLAFDEKFHRLGRGKGYYDRFLVKTNALKIGICFDFQLYKHIPHDIYDVEMDIIVSEKSFLKKH